MVDEKMGMEKKKSPLFLMGNCLFLKEKIYNL